MRKFIYSIVSILMAVIVLLSTMSFTVNKHYCGGFLVNVSFIGNVERCDLNKSTSVTVKKRDCCKDEVHHIEGQDQLQNENFNKLTFEKQKTLVAFVISSSFSFFELKEEKQFSRDFKPLVLDQDLQVLYETFLI